MAEVTSIAVMEALEGKQDDLLTVLHELYAVLALKNYSTNELYQDPKTQQLINIRHWKSEAHRERAQEDPDVQRCWAKMGLLCEVRVVYETLVGIWNRNDR